jgi:hypothetical protein
MGLPLDEAIILALLTLVLLVFAYERSRKPSLLPNAFKLGKWVYLFALGFAAAWAVVAFLIYKTGGDMSTIITLWIAAAIAWGGGWVFRWALRR